MTGGGIVRFGLLTAPHVSEREEAIRMPDANHYLDRRAS